MYRNPSLSTEPTSPDAVLYGDFAFDRVSLVNVGSDQNLHRVDEIRFGKTYGIVTGISGFDFGDAPDASSGTGPGNYNTSATDGGPEHAIAVGLYMGASVDGDAGTLQTVAANADDVDQSLPDDEDGLNNPVSDLTMTIGTHPTVNVIVTNTTGRAAVLSGWIDYNNNGLFDNGTERAQASIADGSLAGIVTLVFPIVPTGFTGKTYARFRLSTDRRATNPTGTAGVAVQSVKSTLDELGASVMNCAWTLSS